jgi:hypothetical protein
VLRAVKGLTGIFNAAMMYPGDEYREHLANAEPDGSALRDDLVKKINDIPDVNLAY